MQRKLFVNEMRKVLLLLRVSLLQLLQLWLITCHMPSSPPMPSGQAQTVQVQVALPLLQQQQ